VEDYRTPYEKLVSLPKWDQHLKPGITTRMLQQQALRRSDTEAAQEMQKAKLALLAKSRGPQVNPYLKTSGVGRQNGLKAQAEI